MVFDIRWIEVPGSIKYIWTIRDLTVSETIPIAKSLNVFDTQEECSEAMEAVKRRMREEGLNC